MRTFTSNFPVAKYFLSFDRTFFLFICLQPIYFRKYYSRFNVKARFSEIYFAPGFTFLNVLLLSDLLFSFAVSEETKID